MTEQIYDLDRCRQYLEDLNSLQGSVPATLAHFSIGSAIKIHRSQQDEKEMGVLNLENKEKRYFVYFNVLCTQLEASKWGGKNSTDPHWSTKTQAP